MLPNAGISRRSFPNMFAGLASGDFVAPLGMHTTSNARTPSTSATVCAWPFYFGEPTAIDRVRVNLVTAQTGAECRVGVYSNFRGRPLSLLVDGGTIDLSGSTGNLDATVAVTVRGRIWVLVWMKNVATQATLYGPTSMAVGLGPNSVSPSSTAPLSFLALTDTYPGSMPATAPSMGIASALTYPLPYLRAA